MFEYLYEIFNDFIGPNTIKCQQCNYTINTWEAKTYKLLFDYCFECYYDATFDDYDFEIIVQN